MNYDDHNSPHFHVRQGAHVALIEIKSGALLKGNLTPKAIGLVVEWCSIHRSELLRNWELASQHAELEKVDPLE